jgi:hypothetical protein
VLKELFYRPHRKQGRRICEGQLIHGSLLLDPTKPRRNFTSPASYWRVREGCDFAKLIQEEAIRYLNAYDGTPHDPESFWEIDGYESARIFLSNIGLYDMHDTLEGPMNNPRVLDAQSSDSTSTLIFFTF